MAHGFKSYWCIAEERGTVGEDQNDIWGVQARGTIDQSFMYFESESMAPANEIRMTEEIGLRHAFVSEVSVERLLNEFEQLFKEGKRYREVFIDIKRQAYKNYMVALGKV